MTAESASSSHSHEGDDDPRAQALQALEGEFNTLSVQMRQAMSLNAGKVSEGMLPGAYKVFVTIARNGCATLSAITEELAADKGQMSRTIRELEERGLVTRSPDPADGRSHLIRVSDFGRAQLTAVRADQQSELIGAMREWSVSEIAQFTAMVHALARGIRPEQHAPRD